MATITTLASGLAGAIGSHYFGAANRLYFVEYGGRLSSYDFVRPLDAIVVNNAARVLHGTWEMNLDTATEGQAVADIWWEQIDGVKRRMVPRNGARLAFMGVMSVAQFAAVGTAELQALSYGTRSIVGDNNASNQLVPGAVFAVRTGAGRYSKVRVVAYGYDLSLRISTYRLKPAYRVLGTGYVEPEDVKVSADGSQAYITERGGHLLRVALGGAPPNRAAAVVVATDMTAPHQISLHEDRGLAYVVEFGDAAHLVRIDLASGAKTNVAFNLDRAIGLVITADHQFAYVSEQSAAGGRVRRVTLASGAIEPLVDGFTAPFMMSFNDASESGVLIAERDPANRVTLIDLSVNPVVTREIVAGVAHRPSSVALISGTRLIVCSDTVLGSIDLTASVLKGSGPLLLGIGHVPVTKIVSGYADTSADPGYFFQVKDSPFGGTLPVMFNHERARLAGAKYYRCFIDGVATDAPWGDYKWSSSANEFQYVAIVPDAGRYYPVRALGELWYNAWLGLARSTLDLADGLHTIEFRVYNALKLPIAMAGVVKSVQVMIDNKVPTAAITTIFHGAAPVGACGIVDALPDDWSFDIVATDPQQHLLSWSLTALWGDNKSALVASDSYANHVSPTRLWAGAAGIVPAAPWHAAVAGDPTSTRCAHTFVLAMWDRVINGYSYLHYNQVHKSITIMIP